MPTAGQDGDLRAAPFFLEGFKCHDVVADPGYDADGLLALIRASGAKSHIPSTSQRLVHRSVNKRICHRRNLVERFFCRLKDFRRIEPASKSSRETSSPPSLSHQRACEPAVMSPLPSPGISKYIEVPLHRPNFMHSIDMEKIFLRVGLFIGLATLVLTTTLTTVAQAQLPPDPVDIGLPPTPKPVGLPPDPVDIGLPRFPAPMGSSPVPATVELSPTSKSIMSQGASAQECEPIQLATVKTDTLQDGRIKIPVTVEGRPLSFMVDTGGTETTIKWEQAKALGLAPKQTLLKILGVAGRTMNVYVTSSNFSVGELHIKNLPIYVESRALPEADGTLAPDVMRDYDVDVDFSHNSLSLISQDHCPGQVADPTTTGSIVIQMDVTGDGHVRFPVKIDGQDIMATLDTGSVISFISMRTAKLLGIDLKAPGLRLVRDTGQYQILTYPFQSLDFGRVSVRDPPIAIFSDNFTKGLGTDLVLGMNILRQMHLHIAYGEKRLYIAAAQAN